MLEYILLEYQDDLNEQIQKPIQQSHRIKFTTFDVSSNYIVFGATSGGLYIYKRKPCVFLKIIPTKEGIIDKLSISSDECFIASSNPKGSIIIIENSFAGFDIKFQIYNQHNNNRITVLKWHFNDLYSGDTNGKVCVTTFKNTPKSIFQIPSATLMHLDSSIVQIDCYKHYLLISTLTKTLICDQIREQFKQIGTKSRNSPHGACFQNTLKNSEDVRIFCSRPGLRLWQVDFDASVIYTHQFKHAKPMTDGVFIITDTYRAIKHTHNPQNETKTNFYRIHALHSHLLVTFNNHSVYILQIISCKVVLLCNLFFTDCILDIQFLDDIIYVFLDNLVMRCYNIYNVDRFALHALNTGRYLLCADFKELFKYSSVFLNELKGYSEQDELKGLFGDVKITGEDKCFSRPSLDVVKINKFDDDTFCFDVIVRQCMLDRVDYPDLLNYKQLDEVQGLFERIITDETYDLDRNQLTIWCSEQFLRLISKNQSKLSLTKQNKHFIINCFKSINNSNNQTCAKCKYPLPTAKNTPPPHFYNLLCDIFTENDGDILSNLAADIPYVWKYVLMRDFTLHEPARIIIQFGDITILEKHSSGFTYDLWDEAVRLLIKLRSKRCLGCDEQLVFDVVSAISWQAFANVAIQAVGPAMALRLFRNYAGMICNEDLGMEFYQNFIFVAAMDCMGKDRGESARVFSSAMADECQKNEVGNSLAKYLNDCFSRRNNHSHLVISPINSLKNILSNKS